MMILAQFLPDNGTASVLGLFSASFAMLIQFCTPAYILVDICRDIAQYGLK